MLGNFIEFLFVFNNALIELKKLYFLSIDLFPFKFFEIVFIICASCYFFSFFIENPDLVDLKGFSCGFVKKSNSDYVLFYWDI